MQVEKRKSEKNFRSIATTPPIALRVSLNDQLVSKMYFGVLSLPLSLLSVRLQLQMTCGIEFRQLDTGLVSNVFHSF